MISVFISNYTNPYTIAVKCLLHIYKIETNMKESTTGNRATFNYF